MDFQKPFIKPQQITNLADAADEHRLDCKKINLDWKSAQIRFIRMICVTLGLIVKRFRKCIEV